ncbi:MAG TPA: DegT/DnrJ/EryC1/StrS family aminotransferase [Acidobacteriaceae bacterium]|nr:DegT/DnrJ/EryC1/StrS family aminotransferase [Acidobacteriaceae bacterium]
MDFVDLKAQYRLIKERVDAGIHAVLEHGQYILGPEVAQLETELAGRTGSRHCIACASGTDALLIALMALGIGPGDEVITSPFTFIATVEMIALLGAKPVFVDIDAKTYNLDPAKLAAAITPKTRAIMPVSLYGQCADFDAIAAAAGDVPVIEDAAQSFGATYQGRSSCNVSTIGCTSFFPSKPLGCYGDGGACFTNDDALAEVMRQVGNHGQASRYNHVRVGVNGRLDSMQAAVLLAKLEVFDREITLREEAAARYDARLKGVVQTPHIAEGNTSVYAQYTIELEEREWVADALRREGIPTAVHYPAPAHLQPAFAGRGYKGGEFPAAERAAERVLSLPMHPYLKADDQEKIGAALERVVKHGASAAVFDSAR